MASHSWMQFCLIIAFIIFAKCVIIGVGFPVETFVEEENQESACDIQMLTIFKSKVKELTQEVEILIKEEKERGIGFYNSRVQEAELGSGIYSTQELYLTTIKSKLTELTQKLEMETLINYGMEEGSPSGNNPSQYGMEKGSASGSNPSQEGNDEGSASSCNPQVMSMIEIWLTSLDLQVQAVKNASKATVDQTEVTFTDQVCPDGWALHGHSCFHIIDTPTPKWRKARTMCRRLGGDLGKITTASENQFVYDLLRKQKTVTHYGVWLGLYRKKDQHFYWVNDTPLSGYTAWGHGEPNNSPAHGGENCVHKIGEKRSWPFQPGQWNDVPCSLYGIVPSHIAPVVLCQKKIAIDVLSF